MKRQSEKPPIDDLFARKLDDMSLPPGADAFARLQVRMNQQKPETKLVFWRNPTVQRYMAVAACLLLVCLFGWQYWSADGVEPTNQIAAGKEPHRSQIISEKLEQQAKRESQPTEKAAAPMTSQPVSRDLSDRENTEVQIARAEITDSKSNQRSMTKAAITRDNPLAAINKMAGSAGKVAKGEVVIDGKSAEVPSQEALTVNNKLQEQVAPTAVKPASVSERVLVVTIAEPVTLPTDRMDVKTVSDPKPALAITEKEDSKATTKIGSLWQQVKRVKSGEAFASRTNTNDERGLLSRAYNELKQTLDKDKPQKQ